jgi:hypothetical protein
VLVVLLVAALTAVSAATTTLRCVDAARETARAAARGEADPVAVGRRSAPAGARITVSASADGIRVEVAAPVRPLGLRLVGEVDATAVAEPEPGEDDVP